jgi:hypothetical protein
MSITWSNIISDAYMEIGALAAGETLDSDLQTFALGKANRILDNWNAEQCAVYADTFTNYTLTPSLDPHTIGPTGTFVVASRPVSIEGASWVMSGSPEVYIPIAIHDRQWFDDLSIPGMTAGIVTDLFYNPTWPNGSLHFWPVPNVANDVNLWVRTLLSQVATSDTFTLPPGYKDAITLTLAEELAPSVGKQLDPRTLLSAQKARARIFANNDVTPRITTTDAGMPGSGGGSYFNYLSRSFNP